MRCPPAVVLAGALLVLVPSGASASGKPPPPGEPFGERIEGGEDVTSTTVVGTGTYAVPLPGPDELQFFEVERPDPASTIWYGITAQYAEPTSAEVSIAAFGDGDERRECNERGVVIDDTSVNSTLHSSDRSPDCRDAESLVIVVQPISGLSGEELPDDGLYQLTVWVEPGVSEPDTLPAPVPDSPWAGPREPGDDEAPATTGARILSNAEPLGDGAHTVRLRQGETQVFGFPLTYGEHAQVLASTRAEDAGLLDLVEPIWISPLGGVLRTVVPAGGPEPGPDLFGENLPQGWATPVLSWSNRRLTGEASGGPISGVAAPAAVSGTYFLLLTMPAGDDVPAELDVRMEARTVVDYEGSVPSYDAAPPPLPALDGSGYVATAEQEREAARAAAGDGAAPPWPLVAGLFAGAALLAVVGGIASSRLRRGHR